MPRRHQPATDVLRVDGVLPPALSGKYLFIEPSATRGPRIHSVDLHAGAASSHRHRLNSTRAANGSAITNLIRFADRIVALADGAIAQQLGPTLGASPVDAAGRHLGIGAYPKTDPVTGELHLISSPGSSAAEHHILSSGGMTRRTHAITDAPAPVLDLAITRDSLVLLADGFVGVTTRNRRHDITWLTSPPTRPGRIVGAYEADGHPVIHLAGVGLEQWTLDPSRTEATRRIIDPTPQHPARMNEQVEEPAYRYLYAVGGGEQSETRGGRPLVKHDLATGACERRELGDRQLAGEFLFVPDPERRRAEDGGWLVGVVDDEAGAASSVSVLDAADLTGAALSHIHLPRRVRRSLRGLWVPASNDTT